jgi:hypothetical protein
MIAPTGGYGFLGESCVWVSRKMRPRATQRRPRFLGRTKWADGAVVGVNRVALVIVGHSMRAALPAEAAMR